MVVSSPVLEIRSHIATFDRIVRAAGSQFLSPGTNCGHLDEKRDSVVRTGLLIPESQVSSSRKPPKTIW